ncbi:MAG: TetR/AcrR family transcriptional regulator [Pseudoclavibacter sp.]
MNSDSTRLELSPKQARSVRSRQLILDAARGVVEDVGIDGLTLAMVASRAGVAVGTVYNRFADRTHLIEEVVEEWTLEVSARFSDSVIETALRDPRARLEALVDLFRRNSPFIRQILIHSPLMPGIADIVTPWLEREKSRLVSDLSRDSEIDRERAALVATMILSTVERAAMNEVDDTYWSHLSTDLPGAGATLLAVH